MPEPSQRQLAEEQPMLPKQDSSVEFTETSVSLQVPPLQVGLLQMVLGHEVAVPHSVQPSESESPHT